MQGHRSQLFYPSFWILITPVELILVNQLESHYRWWSCAEEVHRISFVAPVAGNIEEMIRGKILMKLEMLKG